MERIDLDQNATTPLDPEALEAMKPYWFAGGNAESRHALGRFMRRGFDRAVETVASILHAHPEEVIFTSGGTESNNTAIFGLLRIGDSVATRSPGRIVTSPIEHPSVVQPLEELEALGWGVDHAEVDADGIVAADRFVERFQPDTRLAILMLANNETGAIQPVSKTAESAHERGVLIHTDAVQAVGRIEVDFTSLGVDTLSASGHKFHGPAGIGLLLARRGTPLTPRFFGGNQQHGLRPGTVPVALCVGLAKALERRRSELEQMRIHQCILRDRIEHELIKILGGDRVVRNGPKDEADRLPQTLNLGFSGLEGDALLLGLDLEGVAASLGSACASGATEPSPTLVAMRVPEDRLKSSVRLSLGAFTTSEEIDRAIERIARVAVRLYEGTER